MVEEGKYSLNIFLHFNSLYGRMCNVLADVAEWQTQQTQNLPVVTSCGFKSRHPHLHYMNKAVLYAECELQAYLRMEDTFFIVFVIGKVSRQINVFFWIMACIQ